MPNQETHYRSLFSQMLNGLAYCKVLTEGPAPHDFVYLEVNEAFEKQTGLKNVVGKKVSEVVPGIRELDPGLLNLYSEVAATGQPCKFERYVEALKAWFSVSVYSPEKGYFIAVFDVTTRQREAEAFKESEARFRTMADGAPVLVWIAGLDKGCTWFNRPWLEFTGRTLAQEQGSGWADGVHPDDLARCLEIYTGHFDRRQPFTMEYRLRRRDGQYRWLLDNGQPMSDGAGAFSGYIGSCIDITERRLLEQEARETAARLRAIFQAPNVGIAITAAGKGWVELNDQFCAMLGYTRDEVLRMDWRELTHPDEVATDVAHVNRLLSGEAECFSRDKRYLRKDGTTLWVQLSASCVRRPDRSVEYVVAIVKDLSVRKAAEEQVRVAAAYSRGLIEASLDPLVTISPAGKITDVNLATETATGIPRGRLLGTDFADYFTEPELARAGYRQALEKGAVRDYPLRLRHASGQATEVSYNATTYSGPDGKTAGVFAAAHDLTAIRKAEEALREREARLASIAAYVPGMLYTYVLHPDGTSRFLYVGPRCRDILEVDEHLIMADSSHFWNRIHPGDLERMRQEDAAANREGKHFSAEFRVVTPSGAVKWVNSVARPAPARPGEPAIWNGFMADITDRKVADEALRRSEARFRALAERSPVGIFETDAQGNNTYLNELGGRLLGTPVEQAHGRGWGTSLHPEDRERVFREWDTAVAAGQVFSSEYRFLRPDGTSVMIRGYATALRNEASQNSGYVGVMVDITELRSLERQLAVASRLAAMGTLVAGVAHEINNPLAVIMGNEAVALESVGKLLADLRRGDTIDRGAEIRSLEEVERDLRDSGSSVERIKRIVKDLSTIGKPNAPQARIRLTEIVSGALRWLPVNLRGITEVRVENRGAPDILAAGGQIEQVLVNLLTNAIKASPAGKPTPVTVRIGPGTGGKARLEVIDQGSGIDPASLGRIFEPFFTTREVGQGMGLGLSVCHSIVTAYGGTIDVESKVGAGSTFRVELPVAPAEA